MKNKLLLSTLALLLSVAFLSGCKSDKPSAEKGLLNITAYSDYGVLIDVSDSSDTKNSTPATDNYQVSISHILTGEIAFNTTYGNIKTTPVAIEQGMYRVSAQNIAVEDARWDAPRYAGFKEVTVKAGQTADASIECRMTNCKVTVDCSDNLLLNIFDVNSIEVTSNEGGTLEFVGNTHRAGYFVPGSINVAVKVKKKDNGELRTINYPILTTEAATWYKVKVNLKLFANTGFDIVVDADVIQEHNTEIDPTA